MKQNRREITVCSTFGHNYDPRTGICIDCGDDALLQSWKKK